MLFFLSDDEVEKHKFAMELCWFWFDHCCESANAFLEPSFDISILSWSNIIL